MDAAVFWRIIDATADDDQDIQCEKLAEALEDLPEEALIGFEAAYAERLREANLSSLWAAAYILNGGASDDGFDYFKDWLISRGRTVFEAAIEDPETLVDVAVPFECEFEELRYVAGEVYEATYDQEIDLPPNDSSPASIELDWDEETVDERYPKLAALAEAFEE